VLVATDCLSEGIDLQQHFDAVVHYDLSWNPTRHEQREGRADRYGQKRPEVRALTYYGIDNQIDGIVLDVLLRKHQRIRGSLGISVPVPADTNAVIEALFEGLLLRESAGKKDAAYVQLDFLEDYFKPRKEDLHQRWDAASEREKRSRSLFAQETLRGEEVARELEAARAALGSADDVSAFTAEALRAAGASVTDTAGRLRAGLKGVPPAVRDLAHGRDELLLRFEPPPEDGAELLTRTHPLVAGLAAWTLEGALEGSGLARRSGAIRTRAVEARTALLLLRLRFHMAPGRSGSPEALLAEECRAIAFRGSPSKPEWLGEEAVEELFQAEPSSNIFPDEARGFLEGILKDSSFLVPSIEEAIEEEARRRAAALAEAHERVRRAGRLKGDSVRVEPILPADVLGLYVYLPAPGGKGPGGASR
ncbi:MAG: ATP-dependent helicase, partial [Planctomycetes bacterium]|nr:ATP-dependent helicase [Planctomycetota bacterium]